MGTYINNHIGQIFGVLMVLAGLAFVGSLFWNYSSKSTSTAEAKEPELILDQMQIADIFADGSVQGWDYFNKCKVFSIPYPNQKFEKGQNVKYYHQKEKYEMVEIEF